MTNVNDQSYGVLTDESFERSRRRIGVPIPLPNAPHNLEVSRDGLRHFAFGYGDDNPLYCDPQYAKGTRWGGLINPPAFLYTMGEDASPKPTPPENKAVLKGDPFAGLGSYQAVMDFEWWTPLYIGDELKCLRSQVGLADKRSDFGGRTAHVTHDFIYANGQGELHAIRRGTWVNAERHTSKERKKESDTPEPYTAEQLAEIDACYEAETRRGNVPRYFEDVEIGDVVDRKVKGPLRTTDVVVWHLGWGMQLTPPGSFRLSYLIRKKAPGLFPPNKLNIPDTVQRLHWEPERAQELGLPTSYDYGGLRETWLCHLVSDWMGDDAWLWKLECQHRRFNFIGDTTWLTGEVVDKKQTETAAGVRSEVHLAIRCTNQRGVVTSPGKAVVLLPSREHGEVTLPKPPARTIDEMLAHEIERLQPGA
ncbi:MAG: MaoC family dehydratase N-terminal domain-containing protein [Acidimicrobiia bacterium]